MRSTSRKNFAKFLADIESGLKKGEITEDEARRFVKVARLNFGKGEDVKMLKMFERRKEGY
jgi:hypothetical protein